MCIRRIPGITGLAQHSEAALQIGFQHSLFFVLHRQLLRLFRQGKDKALTVAVGAQGLGVRLAAGWQGSDKTLSRGQHMAAHDGVGVSGNLAAIMASDEEDLRPA